MKTWIVTYKKNGLVRKMPVDAATRLLAKSTFFHFFCSNCVTVISIKEKRVSV